MSLTKTRYRLISIFVLVFAGVISAAVGILGAMTASFVGGDKLSYMAIVVGFHGLLLACSIPAFVVMLVSLHWGTRVQWSLAAIGGLLFFISGFRDGLVVGSLIAMLVPAAGKWLYELQEEVVDSDT